MDHCILRQHDSLLDRVLELTYIALPRVSGQRGNGIAAEVDVGLAVAQTGRFGKMLGKPGNITNTLT